jgi:hypothetical protein
MRAPMCVVLKWNLESFQQKKKRIPPKLQNYDLFSVDESPIIIMISLPSPGSTLQSFFWFGLFVFFLERKRLWHISNGGSLGKFKYEHTPLRFHFADLWQLTPSRHNDFRLSPLLSLFDAFLYITPRVSVWNDYSPFVVKNIMSCVIALCTCNFCLLSSLLFFVAFFLYFNFFFFSIFFGSSSSRNWLK